MDKVLTSEQIQALRALSDAIKTARALMEEDYPNYAARLEALLEHTEDIKNFVRNGADIKLCGKCAAEFEANHHGFFTEKLRDLTRGKETCAECGRRRFCGLHHVVELPF